VPDGFDVRPEAPRRGAADLRSDAGALDGALSGLADGLGRAVDATRQSLEDCANALDAAGTQYLTSDGSAASGLFSVPLPGFDPPS
jgi:hypothetical protein